jgi:hypothetical protein
MDARWDSDEAVKVGRVALSVCECVCGALVCGCENVSRVQSLAVAILL